MITKYTFTLEQFADWLRVFAQLEAHSERQERITCDEKTRAVHHHLAAWYRSMYVAVCMEMDVIRGLGSHGSYTEDQKC